MQAVQALSFQSSFLEYSGLVTLLLLIVRLKVSGQAGNAPVIKVIFRLPCLFGAHVVLSCMTLSDDHFCARMHMLMT